MGARFNMIGVFVTDLEKTIEFYRDVIGLEVEQAGDAYATFEHEGIRFAIFERVMVSEWLGIAVTYPSGLNGTFALSIDVPFFADVDGEFARVVSAGAKEVMVPRDMPWGQRCSMVADPDGNLIEIGSFNTGGKDE